MRVPSPPFSISSAAQLLFIRYVKSHHSCYYDQRFRWGCASIRLLRETLSLTCVARVVIE